MAYGDLSRLGRNYREVGYYTEDFFPEHDVRFVSVSEGIDTAEGEDEFAPFRNIMNEWYAKDISKKRRLSNKVRGGAGEPLSMPPYGYLKDSDNPKRWVVDEEAAEVVRRIYTMTVNGYGIAEIARLLEQDGILTPTHYWHSKGLNRGGLKAGQNSARWQHATIHKMLSLMGHRKKLSFTLISGFVSAKIIRNIFSFSRGRERALENFLTLPGLRSNPS